MNLRIAAAALSVLCGTGCIVVGNGGNRPGNATLLWSFAGKTCSQAGVSTVQVTVPGETLENGGLYNCIARGVEGVVLEDFAGGTYSFTIEGLGSNNETLYSASGTFTINGSTTTTVNLAVASGPNSYAYLTWSFPAVNGQSNPSCATVGVTEVDIYIDNLAATTVSCATGQSAGGATTPYLMAGSHTLTLVAFASNGAELFRYTGSFTTVTGAPSSQNFTMAWSVGGVMLKWTLTENSVGLNCAQAGVANVYVNFRDSQNKFVFEGSGLLSACDAPFAEYRLYPGTYAVFVQAVGSNPMRTYESNLTSPPVVSVTSGVFPASSAALNIIVPRKT